MKFLRIENLSAGYGRIQVVRDISIHVKMDEIVSIIGANGAGKSTLLSSICGIVIPWNGRIFLEEKDITGISMDKIMDFGISIVCEGRQMFESLPVFDNLTLGAYVRLRKGEKKKNIEEQMQFVYETFPILRERRKQLAGTLSGGEQRMLSIGTCLMSKPRLLLLDELSLGLAPIITKEIYRVVADQLRRGLTILLVEQNVRIALNISARAYVMETGRIVLEGRSADLLNDEAVQRAYLGG